MLRYDDVMRRQINGTGRILWFFLVTHVGKLRFSNTYATKYLIWKEDRNVAKAFVILFIQQERNKNIKCFVFMSA